ncbi:uncharacterized protein At1g08160-like [Punica granatum]|uniref:Late embryogenesis abundant protein LEA-2 subgroup domain-containing protein n=2 Tax=Punica granatum TaxID=22663 RepID=A0A218W8X1_PUNGR|nr:uncharacterized protein At1g08160-like [Punica granatum]OWM68939.1 hypothetical protein CDL15_Pgr025126 [Punica granatum]PKI78803.1 hypothetical protein CRG98_000870 [Punica granatum]
MATRLQPPPPQPPPPQLPPPAPRPTHSNIFRCVACILLTLIILAGLCILIIWLVVHPKHVIVSVEDAYVHNYNLTDDHLSATFDLTVVINNRNRHVSFYYDSAELSVRYEDQKLALDTIQPFYQGHKNVTRLYVKPSARDVPLLQVISRNLRLERTAGTVELDVRIRARIRYKVGAWKSRDRTVKIYCSPVLGHFTRSKSFEGTKCNIQL